jgi:RHS repeat-associated protein
VRTTYTKRGSVDEVGGSYGTLVASVIHDADGLPVHIEYGDLAQTSTDFTHDDRRRLRTVQTYRGPPVEWATPPNTYSPAPNLNGPDKVFQSILEDGELFYDDVDNPTEIRDYRNPTVWPAGAKPVTRKAEYDDLYRLTRIRYQYSTGDDTWVSPNDAETQGTQDPRRGKPSPEVSFDKRVLEQTYGYDWLGNETTSGDDAKGFYDRSLGAQSHSGTKPYQLTSATGSSSSRDGSLTIAYDAAGDMTSMAVVRNGPCLPTGAVCSHRYAYDWDELGRMVRARRWDTATPGVASEPLPSGTPDVDLRHTYDASDQRVVKTAVDASANERHAVYVFGSLELRGAAFASGDYTDTKDTEVAYLFAHGVRVARLHYSENSLPTLTSGKLHVLLELPDHLGSSSIVIDRETGELAERSTYMAYGSTESDYRPDRWGSFREDYKFTGKEEDSEVGLQYFGKRFYASGLGRWISSDPLAVHAPQGELGKLEQSSTASTPADLNLYAYVAGRTFASVDPQGLQATRYVPPVRPIVLPSMPPPAPLVEPLSEETLKRLRFINVQVPQVWTGQAGLAERSAAPTVLRLRVTVPVVVQGPGAPSGGYVIRPHGDQQSPRNGMESHHGIPTIVAEAIVPYYAEDPAPSILMPRSEHDKTRGEYNRLNAIFKGAGFKDGIPEAVRSLRTPAERLQFGEWLGDRLMQSIGPMTTERQAAWKAYMEQFTRYYAEQESKARVLEYNAARSSREIQQGPQLIQTPEPKED